MSRPIFIRRLIALAALAVIAGACTPTLVAPYDSGLQQKASAMQAEVATWDLTMRNAAGTVAADPRHPDVIATLNKWRGEADAMLTLAVSADPGVINCSEAAKAAYSAIESSIPASLRVAAQPSSAASNGAASSPSGCEAVLVSGIGTGIEDVATVLKYCKMTWLDDSYFTGLAENRAAAQAPAQPPHAATAAKSNSATTPTKDQQDSLTRSCLAEFKPAAQAPANAASAQHGRAVSALLTTLQAIVYVENRKKAAAPSK